MNKTVLKKRFEEFYEAFNEFMGIDDIPDKEHSEWRVAGDFDFTLPGKEAEFIPELNDIKEIADAFDNGEDFGVPFATAEILKLSLGSGNDFWIGSLRVMPWTKSSDVCDYGFEIIDWDGNVINEYFFFDYFPNEISLLIEGVNFEHLADDINSFVEGYGK